VVTNANDYVIALPSTNAIDVDGMSAGEYRVYVLAFDGVTGVEVGNNISQFGGCFDLSNPFVLDRILCDTACQMPLNLRYTRLSSNRFQVTWDEARDAIGYELLIGLEGESRRFVIPVRRNRVIISTSSTRAIVLRVRTVCSANTRSPYSEYISFRADRSNASARSASTGKVYGDFMIEEPELTVSPNPTADFINLNFESNDAESLLQIYDVTGRVMHSSTIPAGQVAPRISVSDLAEGIYQVVITSDNIMLGQSRFIKM